MKRLIIIALLLSGCGVGSYQMESCATACGTAGIDSVTTFSCTCKGALMPTQMDASKCMEVLRLCGPTDGGWGCTREFWTPVPMACCGSGCMKLADGGWVP